MLRGACTLRQAVTTGSCQCYQSGHNPALTPGMQLVLPGVTIRSRHGTRAPSASHPAWPDYHQPLSLSPPPPLPGFGFAVRGAHTHPNGETPETGPTDGVGGRGTAAPGDHQLWWTGGAVITMGGGLLDFVKLFR